MDTKHGENVFNSCVCYIPPSDSTRSVDLTEFYGILVYQVYVYCKDKPFYICGDFNGRVGALEDFIPGVDTIHVPERNVVDFYVNKEGERVCDFFLLTQTAVF